MAEKYIMDRIRTKMSGFKERQQARVKKRQERKQKMTAYNKLCKEGDSAYNRANAMAARLDSFGR